MAYSDKELLTNNGGQIVNQVFDEDADEYVPLTTDIYGYSSNVAIDPSATVLVNFKGHAIPQAYDEDLKKFVPLELKHFLYEGDDE